MAETDQVTTIVDNATAKSNVSCMAAREGFALEVEEKEDGSDLHMSKVGEPSEKSTVRAGATGGLAGPTVVLVPSDGMGRGDDELGGILIRSFVHTLHEVEPLPDTIIFLNAGVKLTVEGSLALEDLQALEQGDVEILACGTYLGHFGLKDKIVVGQVSNMYSIAEALLAAGSVVAP